VSPNGTKERWNDKDGNPFKDRHHTDHGNSKEHPMVPHDQYWQQNENGKWYLPSDEYPPTDDDIPTPPKIVISTPNYQAGIAIGVAIAGYWVVKWGIAIATTPITGGGSLVIAGATP